jgi:hypothetical protein
MLDSASQKDIAQRLRRIEDHVQGIHEPAARRSCLSAIFGALGGKVETLFGDTIARIDQTADDVHVTPKSAFSLFLRNELYRLLSIGWIADLTAGREFSDRIALPDYRGDPMGLPE